MKKLLIVLLLLALLAPGALDAAAQAPEGDTAYDDLILAPDEHYGEAMLINGTVLEIRESDTGDGQSQALIIIEQTDGPINPVALLYTRPAGHALGIREGWRIAINGIFKTVWDIRNPWGFYVAMPLFENEEGQTIFAVPANMELPAYMTK